MNNFVLDLFEKLHTLEKIEVSKTKRKQACIHICRSNIQTHKQRERELNNKAIP